jgi:hypothetical protein
VTENGDAVELARRLWNEGALPSMIYRALLRLQLGRIELVHVARAAFSLTLAELEHGADRHTDWQHTGEPLPTRNPRASGEQ